MDLSNATVAPIVRNFPDLGEISFPKLSTRELATYGAEMKSKRREQAKADAADAKLKPFEAYRALQIASEEDASIEQIADYISTPDASAKVIEHSLNKANKKEHATKVLESLDPVQTRQLAREITGTHILYRQPVTPAPKPPADSGFGVGGAAPLP